MLIFMRMEVSKQLYPHSDGYKDWNYLLM